MKILCVANERRAAQLAAKALRQIAPDVTLIWARHLPAALRWVDDHRDVAALVVEAAPAPPYSTTKPLRLLYLGDAALAPNCLEDEIDEAVDRMIGHSTDRKEQAELRDAAAGLEAKLAEAEKARQQAEQLRVSEATASAEEIAQLAATLTASLAQATQAHDELRRQLSDAADALERARQDRAVEAVAVATRHTLETKFADSAAARHQAEQRHRSELTAAAAHLADRHTQYDAALALAAAARDALAQQLTRREAELGATLAEAIGTRNALDSQLADAEAALQHGEQRASAERLAAAQRQAELEAQLTQELATRQALEHDLSETLLAGEQARRRFLDEAVAIRDRERADHERALAEMQDQIGHIQRERENLQQSLGTSEAEYRRVSAESTELQHTLDQMRADVQQTLERTSKEHATERARLETLVTEREAELREQSATHAASQQAARKTFTQIEDGLRLALEASSREIAQFQGEHKTLRQELEEARRHREALRTEADRVPQLQNRLEESQKESRRQFESTPNGICRCGLDGAIKHVNRALVRLLGYRTADELRKVDFATTIFESADDLPWLIERCINTGATESVETTWTRKKSDRLVVRLLAAVTSPDSIEIVAEDITHLRVVEEKLRQAQRMEAVGRLASEVAVTCDNLLRDVGQNGQQWLATIDSDTALRHQGELLLTEVARAASFLRQLDVYGKKQTNALEPVNVLRVLRDLEPVIKRVAGDDTELDLPKTASQVDVDVEAECVERLLVNVASYARERMPSGGRLKVELSTVVVDRKFVAQYPNVRPGGHVVITATEVRGIGQPDGTRPASDKPGVDLGALQALVNHCGGHLWMKAEPPGNMVLKIHLPKRASDLTEPHTSVTRSNRGSLMARWFRH